MFVDKTADGFCYYILAYDKKKKTDLASADPAV